MRIAVAAALLASLTASSALAQTPPRPNKTPQAAAKPVQPAAPAKPSLAQLAAQGDASAQYLLGQAYRDGKGVKKNLAEAASWFAIAAGNGEKGAAMDLARAYEQGAGLPRDLHQAAQWWFRAGNLGDEAAKARFLELFLAEETDQIGGPTGAAWLEAVAATGNVDAILALGEAYEKGEGLPADPAKARQWYLEAAYGNDAEAKFRLGRMLLTEPGAWRLVYKDRSREVDNKERDKLYATRAAATQAGGDDREPDVVRPGMVEAEQWLLDAARHGHAEAQYMLGMAYLGGMDLPFSLTNSIGWLSAAAWNGHAPALMVLADLAAKGQGFAGKDPVRAWVNYEMAAAQGAKVAEEARDRLGKSMNQRQLGRARQVAQDLRGN
ncbi:MAG: sel1 repeat family protein [Rhodospirillaceae bacterium]|nr:sel1 repeat family protein [Rhodospirillales bacterium]